MEFKGFMEKIMQHAKRTQEVVVQKSGDVAKITKLKLAIVSLEGKIKEAYNAIGRAVYAAYRADEGDSEVIETKCAEIDAMFAEIEQLKSDYAAVRKMKLCEACGAENADEAAFCSKCGTALPCMAKSVPTADKEETIIEVETTEE